MKILEESKINLDELTRKLWKSFEDYFKKARGYTDENELMEDLAPDIRVYENSHDEIVVQVSAHVGYKTLDKLSLELNKVIAEYDKSAYFEPEMPGLTTAYLNV